MTKPTYVCQQCGFGSGKWHGRCPSCDAWDSLVAVRHLAEALDAAQVG